MLKEENEKTIIYRTYSGKASKMEVMTTAQIDKALKLTWQEISHLANGKKTKTAEVRFREVVTIRMHSEILLMTDEVVFLPV